MGILSVYINCPGCNHFLLYWELATFKNMFFIDNKQAVFEKR